MDATATASNTTCPPNHHPGRQLHREIPRGSNSGQRMVYNTKTGSVKSGGDGTRVKTVIQPRSATTGSKPEATKPEATK